MGADNTFGENNFNPGESVALKGKKQSKIEKISEGDFRKSKKVVEKYKNQLRQEIEKEQKNCKHEDFYRYEYDEDHYINVCRKCFHEWEEKDRPFLLADYYDLTHGKFQKTQQDTENQKMYKARLESIDKL